MSQRTWNRWTIADLELLREFYPQRGSNIPQLIDRFTRPAIKMKAFALGIKIGKGRTQVIPKTSPFRLSLRDKAYMAGFLDGEGNIANRKANFIISIFNTNEEVIRFIKQRVSRGDISVDKRKGRQDLYSFDLRRDADVYWLLKQLLPFLIIKREKAKEVLLSLAQKYSIPHQLPL